MVSVLIPARNEKLNIRNCVDSLIKQDYPNYEIIVLDDNSTDNTAEIVRQLIDTDSRIQLFHGEPLPEDWAGKPFACYQLARKARGDWLLFVDADTTHSPNMLRGVINLALAGKVSLLSGFPRQIAFTMPQKIAIPMMYFILLSWLPMWWIHKSPKLRPSLAIGQFLLFPREAYWRMGGHQAVKSRILEDVWLGVEVTRAGGRHIAIDLSEITSCHMYRNMAEMSEGFVRWMYSVASLSPLFLCAMMAAGFIFYLAPYFWLWRGIVQGYAAFWLGLVGLQIIIGFTMRYLLDNHFKESIVSTVLYPLGIVFLLLSCLRAIWQLMTGVGVQWKKRLYDKESCVK
ncbi:MAG: glycosyltransferase [Dehalococcoidales bacterium]|nr:glycosyltransferase [Dehalococcoidales bacterium]